MKMKPNPDLEPPGWSCYLVDRVTDGPEYEPRNLRILAPIGLRFIGSL